MLRITFFLSPSQSDCGRPSLGGYLLLAALPEESQRSFGCHVFAVASTIHEGGKKLQDDSSCRVLVCPFLLLMRTMMFSLSFRSRIRVSMTPRVEPGSHQP